MSEIVDGIKEYMDYNLLDKIGLLDLIKLDKEVGEYTFNQMKKFNEKSSEYYQLDVYLKEYSDSQILCDILVTIEEYSKENKHNIICDFKLLNI